MNRAAGIAPATLATFLEDARRQLDAPLIPAPEVDAAHAGYLAGYTAGHAHGVRDALAEQDHARRHAAAVEVVTNAASTPTHAQLERQRRTPAPTPGGPGGWPAEGVTP